MLPVPDPKQVSSKASQSALGFYSVYSWILLFVKTEVYVYRKAKSQAKQFNLLENSSLKIKISDPLSNWGCLLVLLKY